MIKLNLGNEKRTRMNVNSFQDREYVTPFQQLTKHYQEGQELFKSSKILNFSENHHLPNLARLWISSFTRDQQNISF